MYARSTNGERPRCAALRHGETPFPPPPPPPPPPTPPPPLPQAAPSCPAGRDHSSREPAGSPCQSASVGDVRLSSGGSCVRDDEQKALSASVRVCARVRSAGRTALPLRRDGTGRGGARPPPTPSAPPCLHSVAYGPDWAPCPGALVYCIRATAQPRPAPPSAHAASERLHRSTSISAGQVGRKAPGAARPRCAHHTPRCAASAPPRPAHHSPARGDRAL
ncbi:Protein of unknown function [Gryllus bimaculatus]|nr:Protein of unknown function [Gryllus bimaculatus]